VTKRWQRQRQRRVVLDTGVLLAVAVEADKHHAVCLDWYETYSGQMLLPAMIIEEAAYQINEAAGASAEAEFLQAIADDINQIRLCPLSRDDLTRMASLISQYRDWNIGAADAAVLATAERWGTTNIAAVDRRHFEGFKTKAGGAYTLLPDGLDPR
jgi:predicted nucleic acid-binding protein